MYDFKYRVLGYSYLSDFHILQYAIDFERKPRLLSGEIYNLPSFVSLGEFYYPINVKSPTYDLRQLNARSREHLSGSRTQHVRFMIYEILYAPKIYTHLQRLFVLIFCVNVIKLAASCLATPCRQPHSQRSSGPSGESCRINWLRKLTVWELQLC